MAGNEGQAAASLPTEAPRTVNLRIYTQLAHPHDVIQISEIQAASTIGQLKDQIRHTIPSRPPVRSLKLLHRGHRVRNDEDTLETVLTSVAVQQESSHTFHLVYQDPQRSTSAPPPAAFAMAQSAPTDGSGPGPEQRNPQQAQSPLHNGGHPFLQPPNAFPIPNGGQYMPPNYAHFMAHPQMFAQPPGFQNPFQPQYMHPQGYAQGPPQFTFQHMMPNLPRNPNGGLFQPNLMAVQARPQVNGEGVAPGNQHPAQQSTQETAGRDVNANTTSGGANNAAPGQASGQTGNMNAMIPIGDLLQAQRDAMIHPGNPASGSQPPRPNRENRSAPQTRRSTPTNAQGGHQQQVRQGQVITAQGAGPDAVRWTQIMRSGQMPSAPGLTPHLQLPSQQQVGSQIHVPEALRSATQPWLSAPHAIATSQAMLEQFLQAMEGYCRLVVLTEHSQDPMIRNEMVAAQEHLSSVINARNAHFRTVHGVLTQGPPPGHTSPTSEERATLEELSDRFTRTVNTFEREWRTRVERNETARQDEGNANADQGSTNAESNEPLEPARQHADAYLVNSPAGVWGIVCTDQGQVGTNGSPLRAMRPPPQSFQYPTYMHHPQLFQQPQFPLHYQIQQYPQSAQQPQMFHQAQQAQHHQARTPEEAIAHIQNLQNRLQGVSQSTQILDQLTRNMSARTGALEAQVPSDPAQAQALRDSSNTSGRDEIANAEATLNELNQQMEAIHSLMRNTNNALDDITTHTGMGQVRGDRPYHFQSSNPQHQNQAQHQNQNQAPNPSQSQRQQHQHPIPQPDPSLQHLRETVNPPIPNINVNAPNTADPHRPVPPNALAADHQNLAYPPAHPNHQNHNQNHNHPHPHPPNHDPAAPPDQPDQNINAIAINLTPLFQALWLFLRIYGMMWLFLGGFGSSWLSWRFLALCAGSVVYWAVQAGVGRGYVEGVRGWWEGVLGEGGGGGQERDGNGNGDLANGAAGQGVREVRDNRERRDHERGRGDMAARLAQTALPNEVRQANEARPGNHTPYAGQAGQHNVQPNAPQRGPIREALRPLEQTLALLVASLWPGVGERHVAERERVARVEREEREREERERERERNDAQGRVGVREGSGEITGDGADGGDGGGQNGGLGGGNKEGSSGGPRTGDGQASSSGVQASSQGDGGGSTVHRRAGGAGTDAT